MHNSLFGFVPQDLYLDFEAYEMFVWVTSKPNRVYIVLARVMKTLRISPKKAWWKVIVDTW